METSSRDLPSLFSDKRKRQKVGLSRRAPLRPQARQQQVLRWFSRPVIQVRLSASTALREPTPASCFSSVSNPLFGGFKPLGCGPSHTRAAVRQPATAHPTVSCLATTKTQQSTQTEMATTALDRLLFAQGGDCFFCHEALPRGDASVEHLVASTLGGGDNDENCVACCKTLNRLFGRMSVSARPSHP